MSGVQLHIQHILANSDPGIPCTEYKICILCTVRTTEIVQVVAMLVIYSGHSLFIVIVPY